MKKKYIADKIFLHTIIGTEIYIGKERTCQHCLQYQRRQELAIESRKDLLV
jgi:hypothetical protein